MAVVAWMLVILYLSTMRTTPQYGTTLPNLMHFVEYAILALLVRSALTATAPLGALALDALSVVWAGVYGALMEAAQLYAPTRSADIKDILVNIAGALVAVIVIKFAIARKRVR